MFLTYYQWLVWSLLPVQSVWSKPITNQSANSTQLFHKVKQAVVFNKHKYKRENVRTREKKYRMKN